MQFHGTLIQFRSNNMSLSQIDPIALEIAFSRSRYIYIRAASNNNI